MADFPNAIYEERDTENLPGITYDPTQKQNLFAEDFQHHAEEIIALENFLFGTDPKFTEGVSLNTIFQKNSLLVLTNNDTELETIETENLDLLEEIHCPNLITVTGEINAIERPAITILDFPVLTSVGDMTIGWNSALVTLDLSSLETGEDLEFSGNTLLTALVLSALTTCGNFTLQESEGTESIDLSALVTAGDIQIGDNPALESLDLSALVTANGVAVSNSPLITSLDLSSLVNCSSIGISFNDGLVSVDLSSLISEGNKYVQNNSALTTLTISASIQSTVLDFSFNALSQASVNDILAKVNSAGYSNGTLLLNYGTNASPTGGASNANYLALVARGWDVQIN